MVIGTIADRLTRGVENVTDTLTSPFTEPVIRLGVTGLSRAGKTVFITSLVANLMDRARMPQLVANADGRIVAAYPQPVFWQGGCSQDTVGNGNWYFVCTDETTHETAVSGGYLTVSPTSDSNATSDATGRITV